MKLVSISSGKGGVGKTTVVCNLALALAAQNQRVLIIDAEMGLSNVDIFFGVRPQAHLGDVIRGKTIQECVMPVLKNIDLLAGGSGLIELAQLNSFQRRELMNQVQEMEFNYDIVLIDNSSGIHEHILHLNAVAHECVIVLTQDPTSFADSYALIKLMNQKYKTHQFKIICNQVRQGHGENTFIKFSEVVEKFLSVRLNYLGSLPFDENVLKAQQLQRLVLRQNFSKTFCEELKTIANEIQYELSQDLNIIKSQGTAAKGLDSLFKPVSGHA